jgi:hypothetical protein
MYPSDFAVDKHLFGFTSSTSTAYPFPWDDNQWFHVPGGAAKSLESLASFVLEGDIPVNWFLSSDPAASQNIEPALHNDPTLGNRGHSHLSPPRLSTHHLLGLLWTENSLCTSPIRTTFRRLKQDHSSRSKTHPMRLPGPHREANPNRQALKPALSSVARRSKRPKLSVHSVCNLDHLLKLC